MKIVNYPEGLSLAEYLAIEQELVKTVTEPTLFTWIVRPTVIYGRHQLAEVEVNEAYCREHGIQVVQRKSGGGCVYADEGNLMVSYISPQPSAISYPLFMEMMARALQQLGYEAVTTQHNDVMVGEHKVSGTACYTTPTGSVVHACVLYKVNLTALENAITPPPAKLAKHGVASVRQRVINLSDIKDLGDIQVFREQLENELNRK